VRGRLAAAALAGWIALGPVADARAHSELHDRIEEATAEITRSPGDAELRLKRAELLRRHEDWDAALADYDAAARLAPDHPELAFLRGRALVQAGRPADARAPLAAFAEAHPDDPRAHLWHSRALAGAGEIEAAAAAISRTIALLDRPLPELYLERAKLLASLPDGTDRAIASLDEGVERIGPLVSLVEHVADLEATRKRPAAALSWLDRLPDAVRETPKWLARRATHLRALGRVEEADATDCRALERLRALPDARRNAEANRILEAALAGRGAECDGASGARRSPP